jgi:hypothetical protein
MGAAVVRSIWKCLSINSQQLLQQELESVEVLLTSLFLIQHEEKAKKHSLSSNDDALNNNPIAKVVEDAGTVDTVLMKTHRPHVDIQDQYQLHVMLRQLLLVKILFAVPMSQQQQQQWLGETNLKLKQIDVSCQIVAPALTGLFMGFFDGNGNNLRNGTGPILILWVVAWNAVALLVE